MLDYRSVWHFSSLKGTISKRNKLDNPLIPSFSRGKMIGFFCGGVKLKGAHENDGPESMNYEILLGS